MFMLKFYLVSILIYWVSLMIATSIIKGQLKKEGLHPKKSSVVEAIANWSQTMQSLSATIKRFSQIVICSCLPVFNLVMAIAMFAKFDDIYYRVKKKCLPEISTNITQLFNLPPEGDK